MARVFVMLLGASLRMTASMQRFGFIWLLPLCCWLLENSFPHHQYVALCAADVATFCTGRASS